MKRASVSEAKNGFSSLLNDVRRGETVLITHRGEPVARIEPCRLGDMRMDEVAAELVRRGVATPPRARIDVERFLSRPLPKLAEGLSASEIVVAERRGSR